MYFIRWYDDNGKDFFDDYGEIFHSEFDAECAGERASAGAYWEVIHTKIIEIDFTK